MRRKFRTATGVAVAFVAGAVAGPVVTSTVVPALAQDSGRADTYRLLNLFGDVFERVRADYVDPVNDRDAIENASMACCKGSTRTAPT